MIAKRVLMTSLFVGGAAYGGVGMAFAQVDGVEGSSSAIQRERVEIPREDGDGIFDLPDVDTLLAKRDGLPSVGVTFVLSTIEITGSSPIGDASLRAIADEYTGREVTQSELIEMRDRMTVEMVRAGYITSGVVIPDQSVDDGTLTVEARAGVLSEVVVSTDGELDADYVTGILWPNAEKPLDAGELRGRFKRLLKDSHVASANARLEPGTVQGEARLNIDVTEAPDWDLIAFTGTDRSPSIGGLRGGVVGVKRNLFTPGDGIGIEMGATEGLLDFLVNYDMPIADTGWKLLFDATYADAEVIEEPLNELDVTSKSFSASAGLRVPLIIKDNFSLISTSRITHKESEAELAGVPFSFSPGAVDGKTEITTFRTSASLTYFGNGYAMQSSLTLTKGLDALEAEAVAPSIPGEEFTYLNGSIEVFAQSPFRASHKIIGNVRVQQADDVLYSQERMSMGGLNSVRGYRSNELLVDRGFTAGIEYRFPVSDIITPLQDTLYGSASRLEAGIFLAHGEGDNARGVDPTVDSITSGGLNLKWRPNNVLSIDAFAAARFEDVPPRDEDPIQDEGFGFMVRLDLAEIIRNRS